MQSLKSNITIEIMPTIVNSYFVTIVGYLYGFDFLIGASSNLFGVWIILNSKELRNKTYFLILSCFFLANVLVACSVSLPAFLNTVLKSDLEFDSLIWCKMSLFLYAFSMQFSSWIIVSWVFFTNFFSGHFLT